MIPRRDIPIELLSSIADRLGLIELLSFRGSCKEFRGASSTASAQIESTRQPWLLCYRQETSQCLLYNQSESKKYKLNIPELQGATCLASYQGWLLLFKKGSIFFFCPFSLAKISLPDFPCSEVSDHIGSFSSSPMDPDCVVSVINRVDVSKVELNVISRGEKEWSQHRFIDGNYLGTITSVTFSRKKGNFYFLEKSGKMVGMYSVVDKKWVIYRIINGQETTERLPFGYLSRYSGTGKDGKLCSYSDVKVDDIREWFNLEKDEPLTIYGTTVEGGGPGPGPGPSCNIISLVRKNESIGVSDDASNNGGQARVILIQPRFFDVASNQTWFT